ncbi:Probable RNA-directed DNA polymerase from transposon BS [Eumeta japonica]|uniref:Probable RNA-directed DNA polymerase from transposon BS n=1 Tax=Eumeta variegata TaxID=151549 RepID=A0A4C1XIR3_EUMVA|nr:Probable RNA-directed DNA polymerase from transposon BS [Eumeta japonica]
MGFSPPSSPLSHGENYKKKCTRPSEGFKRKRKTVAVFFDVANAFDKVWYADLIYKLYRLQVPDCLVFIIHQYVTNGHFSFRHENSTSAKRLLRAEVPQGSTLCSLLYSAYTNDIPRTQTGVHLTLFVDDTALYLRGSHFRQITPRLQKTINQLTRWFQTWRIEVNPEKSAAIFFNYSKIPNFTHMQLTYSVASQIQIFRNHA